MKKSQLLCALLCLTLIDFANAASCSITFSMASYSSVYQSYGYHFIPFSSDAPSTNGGGQFFVNTSNGWWVSTPTAWGDKQTIVINNTQDCAKVYSNGVTEVKVAYADLLSLHNSSADNATAYCLAPGMIPAAKSTSITLPAFGEDSSKWTAC